jgi:hypothetical protein
MGVYEASGQLNKGIKDLMLRWGEVRASWTDSNSEAFEKERLAPIERDLRHAVAAMSQMGVMLQRIRRDCE